jgi:hypothetical protein
LAARKASPCSLKTPAESGRASSPGRQQANSPQNRAPQISILRCGIARIPILHGQPGKKWGHLGLAFEIRDSRPQIRTRRYAAAPQRSPPHRPGKISRRPSLPISALRTSILRLHPESGFAG